MISSIELQYVAGDINKVPYPGDNYAIDVMDKLIKAFNLYKEKYQDKLYSIVLSNWEEINFAIMQKNLCHMLGIDYKNIMSEEMQSVRENILNINSNEYTTSYAILSKIMDRAEDIIMNDKTRSNNKILNYYKILVKSSIFMKMTNFTSFNFGFINFEKNIFNEYTDRLLKLKSTKLIFTPNNDLLTPYYMMGMKQDNTNNIFVPETLFASPDFANFFINQELLVPIQLLINDKENLSKLIATSDEKLNILKMYKSIIQEYQTNSFINIYNDYERILREKTLSK